MSAEVIEFPDDDTIPLITGPQLVDAEAGQLARHLRPMPWRARARFLNRIVDLSGERIAKVNELAPSEEARGDFVVWSMIEMRRRIGEIIDLLGETEPGSIPAAAVFHLSLKPDHLQAALRWTRSHRDKWTGLEFFDDDVERRWPHLAFLYRLFEFGGVWQRAVWRAETAPCPLNSWPAPAAAE